MEQGNLKIPLTLIKDYKLSFLACFLYGELSGLYFKYHKCDITDQKLSERLNRSIPRIQSGLKELKDSGLIKSKQKPNYRGRNIIVTKLNDEKFILIPVAIIRYNALSQNALLSYGVIYSEIQKQIKINSDKKKDNAQPIIQTSKSELANKLNISPRSISRTLHELMTKQYIILNSLNGVGIEITLLPVDNSKITGRPLNDLGQKREATHDKNENPPRTKTRSHLGQKRETNRYLIDINKDDNYSLSSSNKDFLRYHTALDEIMTDPFFNPQELHSLSSPVYDDSLPDESSIPPETDKESYGDYKALNKLDTNKDNSEYQQHKNNTETGKSGSESESKDKKSLSKTTSKKYQKYNGFNLDYQRKELQSMLRRKTNKRYIITSQQIPLLQQRLKESFTLYDFERAIDYLIQQRRAISVKDLLINISNYLNKINSN